MPPTMTCGESSGQRLGNEGVNRGFNNLGCIIAAMDLAQDESPFDKCRVPIGERFRVGRSCRYSKVAEEVSILALVLCRHLMDRIMGIGEFGRCIDELTTAEVGRVEPDI